MYLAYEIKVHLSLALKTRFQIWSINQATNLAHDVHKGVLKLYHLHIWVIKQRFVITISPHTWCYKILACGTTIVMVYLRPSWDPDRSTTNCHIVEQDHIVGFSL